MIDDICEYFVILPPNKGFSGSVVSFAYKNRKEARYVHRTRVPRFLESFSLLGLSCFSRAHETVKQRDAILWILNGNFKKSDTSAIKRKKCLRCRKDNFPFPATAKRSLQ